MRFGRIVLEVNTHRLTESDFSCDFILSSHDVRSPRAAAAFAGARQFAERV